MTFQQVRAWSVLDEQVLDVMQRLRRELFVPEAWRGATYGDLPIALGDGQHMLRPSVAGRLLQAIALKRGDRVLEIGTHDPSRRPFLDWLRQSVLELPEPTLDSVFADTARFTVPCMKINLQPKDPP